MKMVKSHISSSALDPSSSGLFRFFRWFFGDLDVPLKLLQISVLASEFFKVVFTLGTLQFCFPAQISKHF